MILVSLLLAICSGLILVASPLYAYFLLFMACIIGFYAILDRKSDQNGLDFGQELDYDTASKMCYEKMKREKDIHRIDIAKKAAVIAEKKRYKVLSKIASGQRRVGVYAGWLAGDSNFRVEFEKAMGCGYITEVCGPFLIFEIKPQ